MPEKIPSKIKKSLDIHDESLESSASSKKTVIIMQKIQILSCSSFLPSQIIKSDDLFEEFKSEQQYGIDKKWMSEKMGIKERRICETDMQPSQLAIPAVEKAISKAGISKNQIGLVIFCGIEKDYSEPATAHNIQDQIGLNAKYVFDVSNACYGFIDSMKIASNFIFNGDIEYALICTGEIPGKILKAATNFLKDGTDIRTARKVLGALSVGDAGGAAIIGRSVDNHSGFQVFNTFVDSKHTQKCVYKIGNDGLPSGQMLMGPITKAIVSAHENLIDDTLARLGWEKFDWMLSHQMGQKPFDRISALKGVGKNKMVKTFDKLGNITSATFPVNFEKLTKSGKVSKGDRVGGCFAGSGLAIGQIGYIF